MTTEGLSKHKNGRRNTVKETVLGLKVCTTTTKLISPNLILVNTGPVSSHHLDLLGLVCQCTCVQSLMLGLP